MTIETKFISSICLILLSTLAGYFTRTKGYLKEENANWIMVFVTVAGYPAVGFLAIWGMSLQWSDIWLPVLGFAQATIMAMLAILVAKRFLKDKLEHGLLGLCCSIGNHGITMAGFVVFLLFREQGLGLNTIYAQYTFFAVVLLMYTIAQKYSPDVPPQHIITLMIKNLLHWRAIGLYACLIAVAITALGIPKPKFIETFHFLDVFIYLLIFVAYFAIGLRLHLPYLLKVKRAILSVLIIRHGVGLVLGFGLAGLTLLTPWPLEGMAWSVFIIQASVPMGVMGVAVANMFHLKPQEASVIFVASSVVYLLLGVPLVLWIFS